MQWVAETSLWVGKSLTRPVEVSVLSQAAGLLTLRDAGHVVSSLKRNARPRDAVRGAVNTARLTADAGWMTPAVVQVRGPS